jgi:hypothetical protein
LLSGTNRTNENDEVNKKNVINNFESIQKYEKEMIVIEHDSLFNTGT